MGTIVSNGGTLVGDKLVLSACQSASPVYPWQASLSDASNGPVAVCLFFWKGKMQKVLPLFFVNGKLITNSNGAIITVVVQFKFVFDNTFLGSRYSPGRRKCQKGGLGVNFHIFSQQPLESNFASAPSHRMVHIHLPATIECLASKASPFLLLSMSLVSAWRPTTICLTHYNHSSVLWFMHIWFSNSRGVKLWCGCGALFNLNITAAEWV